MDRLRQAEQEYRKAFQEFSAQVQRVQSLTAKKHVDAKIIEAALLDLERAHVNYDICRDRWVEHFLPETAKAANELEHSHEDCIRTIAGLLWENAGRPDGTADEDWRKAEEIVKQAAAAVAA